MAIFRIAKNNVAHVLFYGNLQNFGEQSGNYTAILAD